LFLREHGGRGEIAREQGVTARTCLFFTAARGKVGVWGCYDLKVEIPWKEKVYCRGSLRRENQESKQRKGSDVLLFLVFKNEERRA